MPLDLPPRNEYETRVAWEQACWKKITESPAAFERLVSSHERHDIVMRAAAEKLLATGASYRKIGEELWLSSQTVSSIKKAFRKGYRSYFERGKTERKKKVYSDIDISRRDRGPARMGRPKRTKYGTVWMP